MIRAGVIVSLLERFGGYTLDTLLAEDANLMQLVTLADIAREHEKGDSDGIE